MLAVGIQKGELILEICEVAALAQRVQENVEKVIVGKGSVVEKVLTALLVVPGIFSWRICPEPGRPL